MGEHEYGLDLLVGTEESYHSCHLFFRYQLSGNVSAGCDGCLRFYYWWECFGDALWNCCRTFLVCFERSLRCEEPEIPSSSSSTQISVNSKHSWNGNWINLIVYSWFCSKNIVDKKVQQQPQPFTQGKKPQSNEPIIISGRGRKLGG